MRFAGQEWAAGDPAANVKRGLALVPQGRGVFPDLSVVENLMLGAYTQGDRAAARERMDEILELFPILSERRSQSVGTMSGGQQQMVAVGTALMQRPRLMMMDEPSIGLAPVLVQRVLETAVEINRRFGTAIVLVEQNIKTALAMANRAYVMKSGRIVLRSRPPSSWRRRTPGGSFTDGGSGDGRVAPTSRGLLQWATALPVLHRPRSFRT